MRIIENKAIRKQVERLVSCTVCQSTLAITDADIKHKQGVDKVRCPCCRCDFPALTKAEETA